jgi:subtilase family serine protease
MDNGQKGIGMNAVITIKTMAVLSVAALLTQLAYAEPQWASTPRLVGNVQPDAHVKQDLAQPAATASPTGLSPAQIRQAYGFDQLPSTINGTNQIIAIVDAFGDQYATITTTTNGSGHKAVITSTTNITDTTRADWTNFCNQFNLPTDGLTVVYPQGTGTVSTNWALETALDIEWAHAIAPAASILLVVSADNSYSNMFAAVDYAVTNGANVVSMSWGGGEASAVAFDAHFKYPGVTFVACSGDSGELSSGVWYPASSPYVLSVGGTMLATNTDGTWSETAWSGSGGGISTSEAMPGFQSGWQQFPTSNMRSVPDVSYNGSSNSPVSVYCQPRGGWIRVYGTSVGAPQWAALIALANSQSAQGPLGNVNPILYTLASAGTKPPYMNPAYFIDMTSGTNGPDADDAAVVGYDFVTGLGSPMANSLVPALISASSNPDFSLFISPASATVPRTGGTATYTVEISPMGGYAGMVDLSVAGLPFGATAIFQPAMANSSSTLTVDLGTSSTPGSYPLTITGVDSSNAMLSHTTTATLIVAAAPSAVYVTEPSGTNGYSLSGRNLGIQVVLEDDFGSPVAGATVSISTSLNGAFYASGSASTDSTGKAVFTVRNAPSGSYSTTVTSLTGTTLTWDGKTPANSFTKH